MTAVLARGLRKTYGTKTALDGLDLDVGEGTVCGLLGPNGAGKTTAVRILTTLLRPSGGRAEVAGHDVVRRPREVRRNIGLVGQHTAVDELLTGRQNLELFGRLHHLGAAAARARAGELLERFGLRHDGPAKDYSGGMRRRLDLAASLILAPPVLFLDEPTTGLDPRSRQQMWDVIRDLVGSGATLLLTTQYLEEADLLADNIIVIDHGRAIAEGTADELKAHTGGERIELVVADASRTADAARLLAEVAAGEVVSRDRGLSAAASGDGAGQLRALLDRLDEAGIALLDIGLRRPTLDDVFLELTGHEAETTDHGEDTEDEEAVR